MAKRSFKNKYFEKLFSKNKEKREPGLLLETERVPPEIPDLASRIRALDFYIIYFYMDSEIECCSYYNSMISRIRDLNPDLFILISNMEESPLYRAFKIRYCPTVLIGGLIPSTNTRSVSGCSHTKPIPITEFKKMIAEKHGINIKIE